MPEVDGTDFDKRQIYDANMANIVCQSAFLAYAKYHYSVFNQIEQFDGLTPHSWADLEEAGLSHISNVPFRAGWTMIEEAATNRLNMLRASIMFSSIIFREFEKGDEKNPASFFLADPILRRTYGTRLAKILIDTLMRDKDFQDYFLVRLSMAQVAWGLGIAEIDDYCVIPTVPHILDVYFERAEKKENVKTFIKVFYQRPQDLYQLYKKEEKRGWDKSYYLKEGLEEALTWALNRVDTKNYNSWQEIVRSYDLGGNGDGNALNSAYAGSSDVLTWAWIWNEEIEGGVTKTMWLWNRTQVAFDPRYARPDLGADPTMPSGTELSYQRYYKDKKITDFWRLFPNSGMTTTNVLQDYRGLSGYAYEFDISNNILLNSINDGLCMELTLKLQAQYGAQTDAVNQINNIGGITVLPPNMPPAADVGSGRNFQFALQMAEFNRSLFSRNTSSYNPQLSGRLTDRATNEQVQAMSAEVARERSDFATVPMEAMRCALKDMLMRMTYDYQKDDPGYETAHYFRTRVNNDLYILTGQAGLDEPVFDMDEFFKEVVESVDHVKLEYATNDIVGLDQLIQMAPTPEGKAYFMRQRAQALGASYSALEAYFPMDDSPSLNVNNYSLALTENFMFWETGEIGYSAIQSPVIHLETHFTKAMQLIGNVAKGEDPVAVNNWLKNMLPNAQMHLQQLSANPYEVQNFKNFQDLYRQILQITDEIGRVAQKMAEDIAEQQGEQQQQPQMDPVALAKIQMLQVQGQEKMRRTQEQSQFKAEMMREKQDQQMEFAQQRHDQMMKEQAERAALQLIQQQSANQGE